MFGRDETRTIQVLPAPAGIFPHGAQAFLIERHVCEPHGNPRSAGLKVLSVLRLSRRTPTRRRSHPS